MYAAEQFARNSYVVLPELIPAAVIDFLYKYAIKRVDLTDAANDVQVAGARGVYGDPIMEQLLDELLLTVEEVSGKKLYPTYSYFRVYKRGHILHRHYDRPSCEISVSICLGHTGYMRWPLYIEGPSGPFPAEIKPGEGLLYRGLDCAHWREEFAGESLTQLFLHYVDQHGPNAHCKFDGRTGLSRRILNSKLVS